jgi:phage terminase small subunit
MRYSKAHRQKAVQIASQHEVLSAAMPAIRKALKSPDLTEKTVRRWLKHGEDQSPLNDQQKLFVAYYVQCWNATKAAKLAGYSEKSAHAQGHDLLKHPEIQAEVQAYLNNACMGANEVLMRLSAHATADVTEFIGLSEEELKTHPRSWLLKKYKKINDGGKERIEVEVHDPQAALIHIGKHHRVFVDRAEIDHTSAGQPIVASPGMIELFQSMGQHEKKHSQ